MSYLATTDNSETVNHNRQIVSEDFSQGQSNPALQTMHSYLKCIHDTFQSKSTTQNRSEAQDSEYNTDIPQASCACLGF